ncbi:sigma-70 family RNA polymerase sigma factor [Salinicoccus luteus]|uniref:sigma-70 family RNA polymerase sigma factor n=1 Tax=Salinicoccus luteus TaxID=367840 RepID=UPI001FDF6D61|nr:sigma-70 family RNA polymerase sigma factor [Salinicoccus luteus]
MGEGHSVGEIPSTVSECGSSSHTLKDHIFSNVLSSAWEQLTKKQQRVLDLSFVYGYTDTEIGEMFNQSQQSISRLKQRALQNMRQWYVQKQYG